MLAHQAGMPPCHTQVSDQLYRWLQDSFELGVILLRKKLYTQAVKNLDKARRSWNGLPDELAQARIS